MQIHAKLIIELKWIYQKWSLSVQVGRGSNALYLWGIALVPACWGNGELFCTKFLWNRPQMHLEYVLYYTFGSSPSPPCLMCYYLKQSNCEIWITLFASELSRRIYLTVEHNVEHFFSCHKKCVNTVCDEYSILKIKAFHCLTELFVAFWPDIQYTYELTKHLVECLRMKSKEEKRCFKKKKIIPLFFNVLFFSQYEM